MVIRWQSHTKPKGWDNIYIIKWKKLKKKSGKDGIYDSTAPQNSKEVNCMNSGSSIDEGRGVSPRPHSMV